MRRREVRPLQQPRDPVRHAAEARLRPAMRRERHPQRGLARLRDTKEGKRWHAVLAGAPPRFSRTPRGPALPEGLNAEQRAALELADRAEDVALVLENERRMMAADHAAIIQNPLR